MGGCESKGTNMKCVFTPVFRMSINTGKNDKPILHNIVETIDRQRNNYLMI